MQVSLEKVNHVERRLTIVVPAEQVEAAYNKQITKIAKTAKLKGFRPGKAPISYIQQQFGQNARQDALSEVMQAALFEAIKSQNLNPVNTPRVELRPIANDQSFEFVAQFEVLPEIDQIQFKMETIQKPIVDITEEDITQVIGQLQKQHAKWNPVERPAQQTDRLVIDYYPIFEGQSEEANMARNVPIELGRKTMLPGFEEGLVGSKIGDQLTLNLHFPENFNMPERAGKPVDFVVTIKQIFEAEIPQIDASLIERLGVKSGKEEDLRQQIREALEQERHRLVNEKLKNQIFEGLLQQNNIEVPNALISQEAKRIHDEMYANDPHHNHHEHSSEELTTFNEVAKKRVMLGILIAEYAKKNQLVIDKARVSQRIQEIASAYENPAEIITWLSSSAERRAGIESQIMEDQVMEHLLKNVAIHEQKISYSELRGFDR